MPITERTSMSKTTEEIEEFINKKGLDNLLSVEHRSLYFLGVRFDKHWAEDVLPTVKAIQEMLKE
jgi:hypothetical protein